MDKLTNPSVIKKILAQSGFRFSKSLGQNFLTDEGVLDKIIETARIDGSSNVLEIGPGFGTLTQRLCQCAKKVVSVEIDSSVIPILKDNLADFGNVSVINADIMKTDIAALIKSEFASQTVKVCANLPYYITTPVISALLECAGGVTDITVMVQKEVAQRLAAPPGSKGCGAISYLTDYYAECEITATVPSSAFIPQPKVSSAVIRLKMRETPSVEVKSKKVYFDTVRSAFAQRRKTILNSVTNSRIFDITKDEAEQALIRAQLDPKRRGETLSAQELAALSDILGEYISKSRKELDL